LLNVLLNIRNLKIVKCLLKWVKIKCTSIFSFEELELSEKSNNCPNSSVNDNLLESIKLKLNIFNFWVSWWGFESWKRSNVLYDEILMNVLLICVEIQKTRLIPCNLLMSSSWLQMLWIWHALSGTRSSIIVFSSGPRIIRWFKTCSKSSVNSIRIWSRIWVKVFEWISFFCVSCSGSLIRLTFLLLLICSSLPA